MTKTNQTHGLVQVLRKHYTFVIGLLTLAIVVVLLVLGGRQQYISPGFSYSTNLTSSFSRYDQVHDRYDGEQYAQGSFFVQQVGRNSSSSSVRETVSAAALQTGKSITSSSTAFAIDNTSGRILTNRGATQPFMFAPRNVKTTQSFLMQYATYAKPAIMRYSGTEDLSGLQVYKYEADYSDTGVLPAVNVYNQNIPQGQSLQYKPHLSIWVEPTTGWLVKYTENTTAYYYDKASGALFKPAYTFTNATVDENVSQQVAYAQTLRLQLTAAHEVLPSVVLLFTLIALAAFAMRLAKVSVVPMQVTLGFIFAAAFASVVGWILNIDLLKELFIGAIPVNPLTNLCFIVSAIALLLLYKRAAKTATVVLTSFVTLASVTQILAVLQVSPFNPDLVLFRNESIAGQSSMSLLSAFMFFILSVGILKTLVAGHSFTLRFSRVAASIVVTIASVAVACKILLLDRVFSISYIEPVPLSELFLFVLAGYCFFKVMQARHGHRIDTSIVIRRLAVQSLVVLPIIAIGIVAQLQQNLVNQQLQRTFNDQVTTIQKSIQSEAAQYVHVITGAQALFAASTSVERDEWHNYVRALELPRDYPDIKSMGYIQAEPDAAGVQALTQRAHAEGLSQFMLFPSGTRDQYTLVWFVDPMNAKTSQILGYDMFTDVERSKAMELARDNNQATISDKVLLLQETRSPTSGFVMFVPVYKNGTAVSTIDDRQQNLAGYVYVPFDAHSFFSRATSNQLKDINLSVYDGAQPDGSKMLYSNTTAPVMQQGSVLGRTATIYVAGHPWTIAAQATSAFHLSKAQERTPNLVFIVGSLTYFLAVLVLYSVRALRVQAVSLMESTNQGPKKHGRS